MRLAFIDIETTGLDPERHEIWEVGYILRNEGGSRETGFQLTVDLENADAGGLDVGKFFSRHCLGGEAVRWPMAEQEARALLLRDLKGAVLIGNNVAFDAAFLRKFLGSAPWHYHVVDIKALAMGRLAGTPFGRVSPPWDTAEILETIGLPVVKKHEALADAHQAMAVYDWIMS